MKPEKFADRLCDYIEPRIVEICSKFKNGNVNHASLPAFWIGLEGDIVSFLRDNNPQTKPETKVQAESSRHCESQKDKTVDANNQGAKE